MNKVYARPINSRPSKWNQKDTEDALVVGGCCLVAILILVFAFLPYLIWLALWLLAGHPDIMSQWNAWNISLLVIIAIQVVGGAGKQAKK